MSAVTREGASEKGETDDGGGQSLKDQVLEESDEEHKMGVHRLGTEGVERKSQRTAEQGGERRRSTRRCVSSTGSLKEQQVTPRRRRQARVGSERLGQYGGKLFQGIL